MEKKAGSAEPTPTHFGSRYWTVNSYVIATVSLTEESQDRKWCLSYCYPLPYHKRNMWDTFISYLDCGACGTLYLCYI